MSAKERPARDVEREMARVLGVELAISRLLRIGVLVSLCVITVGIAVSFVHHPDQATSKDEYQRLVGPGARIAHTPMEVVDGLAHFRGQAIVVLGLVLLVATPIARVAVSIVAFLHQRDRIFAAVTTLVLLLLLLSFVLGKAEG
jgi:uncharacterized membrane protein